MKSINIKTAIVTSAFGLVTLLGVSEINAQSRNQNDRFPNQGYNQNQRNEMEKQRQYEEQIRLEQKQHEELKAKYERNNGYNHNKNDWQKNVRYKVFQNGKMFVTDARGLEILKQAVIRGYEQGFKNGLADRRNKKKGGFNSLPMYRNANFGFQNSVEMKQYQFFFQKGFSEGYEDGFNTKNFRGWYQNDGNLSEKELKAILKYERF